jgi:hypothetical protein
MTLMGRSILTMALIAGMAAGLAGASLQRPSDRPDAPRTRPPAAVRPPATAGRVPTRPPIADALEGVFANGLRRRLRLNDTQLERIRPALRESLQRRNRLAEDSIRRREELGRAAGEGRNAEEIDRMIRELDETNRQLREARQEFFLSVDPELSPEQRALLRNELPALEEQIRNLIEQSRRQAQSGDRP